VGQRWAELNKQIHKMDKEHGGTNAVTLKITTATEKLEAEQERLRKTSARAAVINEAVKFLETEDQDSPCPVCGTEVPSLREKLQQLWTDKLQGLVQRIAAKIEEIKVELKKLRVVAGQYEKVDAVMVQLLEEKAELREQAAELLHRELTPEDDPVVLVTNELGRLERRLEQLAQAVQERQKHLDLIEQNLAKVRLIRNYLHLESKKQVLETIQKSEAFAKLETLRDQVAQMVEDVEAIKHAFATTTREEAEAKLTAAEQSIDEHFRQLSRHPAVERLKLAITTDKRTHRNAYEITDQDGNDLMPILSQGDLNALALAIFLGLATTAREGSIFGFILMDDPSQSLGTEHKKELVRLLDQVAKHKKLIVATMDAEFHQYLSENITKAKTEYRFGLWTPEQGPSITVSRNLADGGSSTIPKPRPCGTKERIRR
jgi:DNA repair exonuclease SbcCD ATPase subunit